MSSKSARPIEILLVEDNPADIRLTIEGLKEAKIANNLQSATNGDEALDILFRRNKHAAASRPDIVLLDLNLPGTDGREVLRRIKQDDNLKTIPVVVLTSSEAEADILRSYEAHANSFVSKPIDFETFLGVVKGIEAFWFEIVKLPAAIERGEPLPSRSA